MVSEEEMDLARSHDSLDGPECLEMRSMTLRWAGTPLDSARMVASDGILGASGSQGLSGWQDRPQYSGMGGLFGRDMRVAAMRSC
jgi:hypothetical protein